MDDNKPDLLAVAPQLTPDDARSLLSSFTHSQVLSIVQSAALRHPDVLSAFRMNGHPRPDRVSPLLSISLPPLINPRPLVIRCSRGIREDFCPSISAGWISGYCGLKVVFAGVLLVSSSAPFDIVDFCVFRRRRRLRLDFSIQSLGLFSVQVRASVEREREMMYYQFPKFSHQDSLKILDADIQHANSLTLVMRNFGLLCTLYTVGVFVAAELMGFCHSKCKMRCVPSDEIGLQSLGTYPFVFTPMDGLCAQMGNQTFPLSRHGRKATIRDFYAVILPSLQRLHGVLVEWDDCNEENSDMEITGKIRPECSKGFSSVDLEREDECGICLEPCTKMVLPNCCHEISCSVPLLSTYFPLYSDNTSHFQPLIKRGSVQKSGQYEATLQLLSSFTVSLLNLRRDDGSHGLSLSHPLGSSGIVLHDSQGLSLQPHDLITDRVHSLSHHRAGAGDRSTTDHCRRHLSFTTTGALTGAAPQAIDFLAWSQCQTLSTGGFGSIVEREEFPEDFNKYLRTELNWSQLENAVDETHIAGWVFWCRGDNRPPHAPQCSILCALLCLVVGRERASPFRLWWLVVVVDCARVGFWLVLAGLWWWSFIECIAASVDVEVVLMAVWTGGDIVKG
ncbi:hypothetical protein RHGRI_007938 [Rhododendron griersonianum]|uniref:Uncharacterized protein n=1 Tax=Rhododendron griersonianum TaxID=479676 RepID=A0AAV6KYL0_9ERIC|nr:hypothetical protein RHGRI_007938 [Rhododendron griersonianum]